MNVYSIKNVTTPKTQTRGHCQCCGREQAVRGTMSQHGYNVEHGFFSGVCPGRNFVAIETDRTEADAVVKAVRAQAAKLRAYAADLEAGRAFPEQCRKSDMMIDRKNFVPFAEASAYMQRCTLANEISATNFRARSAEEFADFIAARVEQFHGKPLQVVTLADKPAPIQCGEKRVGERGTVLTVYAIDGARVRHTDPKGFRGWTGVQAWRRMEVAQ